MEAEAAEMNLEKERVCRGLREAITMLCKTGLRFDTELSVEGLLGITLDRNEVFLVSIKDTVSVSETDGNLDEYCAEEQQQVEDAIDGRLDITVPEGVTLTGHVLDDDNSLDNSSFLRLNQGLTTHSSRRKSKPMNRNIMSGKAPRKSSTPTQIIQGHMLEPNGTIMHSTNSPLPLSGGIRSVNMNRHILKVPTAHNIHAKHDVKSSFSDDQPVDLQKPKNRNTGKVVENNPPASDPDQTDTLVMIHAYNNTSGYNTQSDKLDQRASVTNAENNRTSLSVKTCLERSYVSNPGSCMSSRDNIETMGDMQDEPIALTCDGTQSSASSVLTNSSANSPKPDVNLAADDYRKHVSPAQGGIEGVLVKPEPIDLEDLQNSGALNCTQPMGGNLPLEGKSADANSTIASLLKAGHGLMGIPLRGYIPPAIPYALDFSGTERSQVVATDLSMIQVQYTFFLIQYCFYDEFIIHLHVT